MRVVFVRVACAVLLLISNGTTNAQVLQDGTCKLVIYIPFTDLREGPPEPHNEDTVYGYGSWPDEATLGKAAFSLLAAAEMARQHFNERNPVIVPELSDLKDTCSITIPEGLYLDSGYDRRFSVRQFQRLLEDRIKQGKETSDDAVCAVISPIADDAAMGISTHTEGLRVPQIAYGTIAYRLSRQDDFPTFARVIPEAQDFGATIAKFFQRDIYKRDVAGIIYDDTDYGEQFESPLEDAEEDLDYVTITESFTEGDDDSIREALEEAKENGYHTIVLITDRPTTVKYVANVADSMGMLGDEYFWILSGDAMPPALVNEIKYEVDSPADKLLRGSALFTNYDRFSYLGESDPFLVEWKNQHGLISIDDLNALRPDRRGAGVTLLLHVVMPSIVVALLHNEY